MAKTKSTKRQLAQQRLAWALYVTEGHAGNLLRIDPKGLAPSHAAILQRAIRDSQAHARSLRLALHELNREVYL